MTTLWKTTGFSAGSDDGSESDADWTIEKVEVVSDNGKGKKPYLLITSGQDEVKIFAEDWNLFKTAIVHLLAKED